MTPALRLHSIQKSFNRRAPSRWHHERKVVKVLGDVSFILPQSKVVAIVGPSGCGKTTLIRIIAGLENPDDGTVIMDTGVRPGVVFQADNCFPWLTVAQNVAFAISAKPRDRNQL